MYIYTRDKNLDIMSQIYERMLFNRKRKRQNIYIQKYVNMIFTYTLII